MVILFGAWIVIFFWCVDSHVCECVCVCQAGSDRTSVAATVSCPSDTYAGVEDVSVIMTVGENNNNIWYSSYMAQDAYRVLQSKCTIIWTLST